MEKYLNKIIRKLKETIPNDVEVLKNDIEQNFQSAINAKIKKLDLVTREEFEIQEKVLQRTREKLEQLEEQMDVLRKTEYLKRLSFIKGIKRAALRSLPAISFASNSKDFICTNHRFRRYRLDAYLNSISIIYDITGVSTFLCGSSKTKKCLICPNAVLYYRMHSFISLDYLWL